MTINDAAPIQLNLTGDSEALPNSVVIPIFLKGGKNTIQFGSPSGQPPALDKIAIDLPSMSQSLTLGIRKQSGPSLRRIWTLDLNNPGRIPAEGAQLNQFSLVQVAGPGMCQPKILVSLPVSVGTIPKESGLTLTLDVPIDFSTSSDSARFNVNFVYSSDRGAGGRRHHRYRVFSIVLRK